MLSEFISGVSRQVGDGRMKLESVTIWLRFGWLPVHGSLFPAHNRLFLLKIRILLLLCAESAGLVRDCKAGLGSFLLFWGSHPVFINCNNVPKVFYREVVSRDTLNKIIGNEAFQFGIICFKKWKFSSSLVFNDMWILTSFSNQISCLNLNFPFGGLKSYTKPECGSRAVTVQVSVAPTVTSSN